MNKQTFPDSPEAPEVETGPHFEGSMNEEQFETESADDADFWHHPDEWLVPGKGFGIGINKAAKRAYTKLAATGEYFLRDGVVVRVNSVNGVTRIEMVRPQEFRGIIESHFKIKQVVAGKDEDSVKKIHSICSVEIAGAILENHEKATLPKIERVVDCPVIDHKGRICRKGYHDHLNGGTYITGGSADTVPLDKARASIVDLFAEYSFATPADRLRAIAMLLTTAMAQGGLISGPIPVDVAEADESQSGKTFRHQGIGCSLQRDSSANLEAARGRREYRRSVCFGASFRSSIHSDR
jgi:hypothetical protein